MKYYTVIVRLSGALSGAVAVEWTNQAAPVGSGQGWEPCLRLEGGAWRFSSAQPFGAAPPHQREPGAFGNLAIRYRLSAAGPWSLAAPGRKEIVIEAVEPPTGPRDPAIAPLAPRAAAPALVLAPGLVGAGRIGTEVSVEPGLWGGEPAPALAFQWRRNGAAIPGAVARAYVPVAADDGANLDCSVKAANATGAATAVTAALRVTYPAPEVFGALAEEVFDEDTGAQVVQTAAAFAGANLAFSATDLGAGGAIDARTGALTLPTDTPVSGRRVTVTATNSGGAASTTLIYTVEAAPAPRTLGAPDVRVLRSDWRPAGQTRTFTPRVEFPGLAKETGARIEFCAPPTGYAGPELWFPVTALTGEPGVWQLPDAAHATLPGFNAAVFENDARRLGRLRFRWRPSTGTLYSQASPGFDAPLPDDVVDVTKFMPTPTEMASAMNAPMFRYTVSLTDPHGPGCNESFSTHYPVVQAMAAFAGDKATYTNGHWTGGKTAAQRLIEQLVYWGSATAQNHPTTEGGFKAQMDLGFASTVAIARITPAVWDSASLTPAIKARLDLVMKGFLVSNVFATSPKNPWYQGGFGPGRDRGLRGYSANVGGVPNFALPPRLIPFIVAQYMGAEGGDGPALAHDFLESFSRAAFANEVKAAWGNTTGDLYKTFAADWDTVRQAAMFPDGSEAHGRGPTAAELEACCRGYKCMGQWTLHQAREVAQYAITFCFQKPIVPGATRPPSGWAGGQNGPAPFNTGLYGVSVATTDNVLDGCLGKLVNGVFDKSAWAGLPNAFEPHMALELDTTDGGGKDDQGNAMPFARSSMGYAQKGVSALLIGVTALAAYGALDKGHTGWPAIRTKLSKGVTDLKYRDQHGHRDYAKGGVGSENSDWNTTYYTTTKNHRMPSRYATAHAILAHLG